MRLRFKLRQRPQKKARIEIIPMIDVIFFLLVFFMISSMSMTHSHGISVQLPKSTTAPKAIKPRFVVTLTKDGGIFVNKTQTSLSNLGTLLAAEMRQSPEEMVIISADQGVNYGIVVQAMEEARKIGVRKFSLATDVGPIVGPPPA